MSENKIEKATFIKLYDHYFDVCSLTRDTPGALPGLTRESSSVQAYFGAHYCAESAVLLIERRALNTAFWKLPWLPRKTLETVGGLSISDAVDAIYEQAHEWKDAVEEIVLTNAPNFDVTPPAAEPLRGTEIMEAVVTEINGGDLDHDGVTVVATLNGSQEK